MSASANPRVSVVIPIRNRSVLFALTARSLVAQTMPDWEAIVVDDGSEPAEFPIITSMVETDQRMRLVRNPGSRPGACACRNAGLAASRGEFVLFLDADDALAPGCLAHRLRHLESDASAAFAVFPVWYFRNLPGDSTALWNGFDDVDDIDRFLTGDSPWQTSGPLWRRAALEQVGPWDERVLSAQDCEFHVRALMTRQKYLKVFEPDAFWRAPGALESIGSKLEHPRYIVNRARMFVRLALALRKAGGLTPSRRRLLAAQFHGHALRSLLPRWVALRLWAGIRGTGLVNSGEYWTALFADAFERGGRRAARLFLGNTFPNLASRQHYGKIHRRLSPSDLPPVS